MQALIFAKESHRLRTKLFQEKFTYSIEQQAEMYNEVGEVIRKYKYSIMDLQLSRSVIAEVWTLESSTVNVEDFYISPWNVLQGYLESTLQVRASFICLSILHNLFTDLCFLPCSVVNKQIEYGGQSLLD